MDSFDRSCVPDAALLHNFLGNAGHERRSTATVVADIGEIDERKLYLGAGYPSMFAYCVGEAHYSESSAYKRIQVARTARRFPQIFPALAEGRLNLTGILLLRPYLSVANAAELLRLAEWKRNAEIEQLIAERFPRTELLPLVSAAPAESPERDVQLAARLVGGTPAADLVPAVGPANATPVLCGRDVPASFAAPAPPPRVTPIAADRVGWQFSSSRALRDKYRRAQELMNCTDIEQVLGAALDLLNEKLGKTKCGATSRPRTGPAPKSQNPRHIPRAVKRAVWKRDQGQCAFVSDSGHRCEARMGLELDHVVPVTRGGTATLDNIRLLCRAHNQHEAERTYGIAFMKGKREAAR